MTVKRLVQYTLRCCRDGVLNDMPEVHAHVRRAIEELRQDPSAERVCDLLLAILQHTPDVPTRPSCAVTWFVRLLAFAKPNTPSLSGILHTTSHLTHAFRYATRFAAMGPVPDRSRDTDSPSLVVPSSYRRTPSSRSVRCSP